MNASKLPDFSRMTPQEAADWIEHNDISALIRQAQRGPEYETVPDSPLGSMVSVTFRAPSTLVAQLDRYAGTDREGRSGLIRRAVGELLQRLEKEGKAA